METADVVIVGGGVMGCSLAYHLARSKVDVLDPAAAPGTEIPSPGGASTREALDFLAALAAGASLVGLDVMEVAPPLDSNDITSLAALKLIFEFWGRTWKPRT